MMMGMGVGGMTEKEACTYSGSMSEVRKSPAGGSTGRDSGWSESVGRKASGLVERLVSDFFLEKDQGGDDSMMNTCRREI